MNERTNEIEAQAHRLNVIWRIIITALVTIALITGFFWFAVSKEVAVTVLVFLLFGMITIAFVIFWDAGQAQHQRTMVEMQRAQQEIMQQSGMAPDLGKVMTAWLTDTGKSMIAVEKAAQVEEQKKIARLPQFDDDDEIIIVEDEKR